MAKPSVKLGVANNYAAAGERIYELSSAYGGCLLSIREDHERKTFTVEISRADSTVRVKVDPSLTFRTKVWADAFGNWHARVDRDTATGDDAEREHARYAIATAISQRGAHADLLVLQVRQVNRTTRDGGLSTEYVEQWPDYTP